jgi:hypothetical protein
MLISPQCPFPMLVVPDSINSFIFSLFRILSLLFVSFPISTMASSKNRHVRLSSRVADSGKEALISCSRCLKRGLICTMSSSSRRCSACIRSGRMCHRELHSDFEWDQLEKQENETNKQIDSVISERSDIQSRLAHLQSQLAIAQA